MPAFDHHLTPLEEIERIGSDFSILNGDDENGIIPDDEYDRLFDHLTDVLRRYGSFSEMTGEEADFKGYRYVDQIPWISIVPTDEVSPVIALQAALDAVQTSHRPFAVSFDYYPESLLVVPPSRVFTTFRSEVFEAAASGSSAEAMM